MTDYKQFFMSSLLIATMRIDKCAGLTYRFSLLCIEK